MTAETPVNKDSFFLLPRGAQLMVAYVLTNELFHFELMKSDGDMVALRGAGWLNVTPSATHGFVNGEFSDSTWQGFEDMEDSILGSVTATEMDRYKARKGKAYPWLW
ncbi:MAG: hypothetical protein SGJ27_05730 [Candidatus Melainabacteria bacterium]|mgnify:CR=1 FL=1|nr:hypothetical protein [Candidatus Melainabacteria bacterium]